MACPSGCLNGGAQPRPPPGTDPREHAAAVAAALAAASAPEDAHALLQRVYALLGAGGVGSAQARKVRRRHFSPCVSFAWCSIMQLFHTSFTDVQSHSGVARSEDGIINIGSSSMQWWWGCGAHGRKECLLHFPCGCFGGSGCLLTSMSAI
jgi:hypothetical protein